MSEIGSKVPDPLAIENVDKPAFDLEEGGNWAAHLGCKQLATSDLVGRMIKGLTLGFPFA